MVGRRYFIPFYGLWCMHKDVDKVYKLDVREDLKFTVALGLQAFEIVALVFGIWYLIS